MSQARLAQSADRKALNLVVVGSSPTVGAFATVRWVVLRCRIVNDFSLKDGLFYR